MILLLLPTLPPALGWAWHVARLAARRAAGSAARRLDAWNRARRAALDETGRGRCGT